MFVTKRIYYEDKILGYSIKESEKDLTEHFMSLYNYKRMYHFISNIDMNKRVISTESYPVSDMTLREYTCFKGAELKKYHPLSRSIQTIITEDRLKYYPFIFEIHGPKEVGKTTEALRFGYDNYINVVYIDFSDEDVIEFFNSRSLNKESLEEYCLHFDYPIFINNNSTLLIADNIESAITMYSFLSNKTILNSLGIHCDVCVLNNNSAKTKGISSENLRYKLTPLSYIEFVENVSSYHILAESDINLFNSYLRIGGFPETVYRYTLWSSKEYSMSFIEDYIYYFSADFDEYLGINEDGENVNIFEKVMKSLVMNNWCVDKCFYQFAQSKYNINKKTMRKYISDLEAMGILIYTSKYLYSSKESDEVIATIRGNYYYPIDVSILNYFNHITGKLTERKLDLCGYTVNNLEVQKIKNYKLFKKIRELHYIVFFEDLNKYLYQLKYSLHLLGPIRYKREGNKYHLLIDMQKIEDYDEDYTEMEMEIDYTVDIYSGQDLLDIKNIINEEYVLGND